MLTDYRSFNLFLAIIQVYCIRKITDTAWLFSIQYTEALAKVTVLFDLQ